MQVSRWFTIAVIMLQMGCSAEPEMTGASSTGDTDTEANEPPPLELDWGACPSGFVSQCARVAMPIDWSDPSSGDTISVLVARRPALQQPATRQLWLLMGGPGDSADVFADLGLVTALGWLAPSTDVYVMEHRGVGESTWLGCPGLEVPPDRFGPPTRDMQACIDSLEATWGAGLAHMSSRGAAHDLHALIEHTRDEGQQVVLYGVSYGTLLVQRFLQLFEDQADAVVLDSLYAPGEQFLDDYDAQWDVVAHELAVHCAGDAVCAERLGTEPWSRIVEIVDRLANGHCAEAGMGGRALDLLAFELLDGDLLREHLFPLLHRLDRCSPHDVEVLARYRETLADLFGPPSARSSEVLRAHIALSEEWRDPPPSADALVRRCDEAVFCPGVSAELGQLASFWPRYVEPLANAWPEFRVPVLVLQGDLDAKTPIETARAIEPRLTGEHQHFLVFPNVPHVVIASSFDRSDPLLPCGLRIMAAFVEQPQSPLPTSCIDELLPIDFVGDAQTNLLFFGTEDRWGDD